MRLWVAQIKKDRFTIYAKQKERKELLEKVLAYVDSDSLSEAIFTALEQFVELKEKRKKNRMKRHAAKTKGIWADDPDIEKALEEIEKRWETWETVEFGALQAQRESDLQDLLFII